MYQLVQRLARRVCIAALQFRRELSVGAWVGAAVSNYAGATMDPVRSSWLGFGPSGQRVIATAVGDPSK